MAGSLGLVAASREAMVEDNGWSLLLFFSRVVVPFWRRDIDGDCASVWEEKNVALVVNDVDIGGIS